MKNGKAIYPTSFLTRRLHSLTGLFLALFLMQHLFVNSQAALFFGEDGKGFIHAVNSIHSLPYLPLIELLLLGVPIFLHALWGIQILREGRFNSFKSDGTEPSLPYYGRNHAFTWQRITSWLLLIFLTLHIWNMRIVEYPQELYTLTDDGMKTSYQVRVEQDEGYTTLAPRLGVTLEKEGTQEMAIAPDFGTAELLVVRETFKSPIKMAFYTLFVLVACYHAFNGLWTWMITWGITLNERSQVLMLRFAYSLMVLVACLGLIAIFGTYWINLYE